MSISRRFLENEPYLVLLLVPILSFFASSHWTSETGLEVTEAEITSLQQWSQGDAGRGRTVVLHPQPEGSVWTDGIELDRGEALLFRLPNPLPISRITIQADVNDAYQVLGRKNTEPAVPLWTAARVSGYGSQPPRHGLQTRTSPRLRFSDAYSYLVVVPTSGDGSYSVSRIALQLSRFRVAPWLAMLSLAIALRLVIALLAVGGGFAVLSQRLLSFWKSWDCVLGILLLAMAYLELSSPLFLGIALALASFVLLSALSTLLLRHPAATAFNLAFAAALILVAGYLVRTQASALLFSTYDPSIDHRMIPNGNEVNPDRIRFLGDADSVEDSDYNVIFLGDSFTEGLFVNYEEAFVYVFEALTKQHSCSSPVRAVNFGWSSSSPILSFRLLHDIGEKYKPDLVVYCLDMTDFYDDLEYERLLQEKSTGVELGDKEVWDTLLLRSTFHGFYAWLKANIVSSIRQVPVPDERFSSFSASPRERFFITSQPLEYSQHLIEEGVVRNLKAIQEFATEKLDAEFALVIYPRAYQYSLRECPKNWEAHYYDVLGPYVLEPFRYFEESASDLPFPVISLLNDFKAEKRFPLYLEEDPHWTPLGHQVAAESLLRHLIQRQILPCPAE